MFVYWMWSNGVPAVMMWLIVSSCPWDILSHGFNSRIDGFGARFNIERWWASNEARTCSLSWSLVGSPTSFIFWWSTPKYAMYSTFLKRCCTWHNWLLVPTLLWAKCEDETHTPKSGNLKSSGTPKNSKLDCKGQNTLHWSVFYTIEKVLKFRCPKWPCMSQLDIWSPSYGQKKGREPN